VALAFRSSGNKLPPFGAKCYFEIIGKMSTKTENQRFFRKLLSLCFKALPSPEHFQTGHACFISVCKKQGQVI